MRDPNLIPPEAPRIPDEWRRHYAQRPLEKLPQDVTRCFDRVFVLERVNDQMQDEMLAMRDRLRTNTLEVWFLFVAAAIEGIALVWALLR